MTSCAVLIGPDRCTERDSSKEPNQDFWKNFAKKTFGRTLPKRRWRLSPRSLWLMASQGNADKLKYSHSSDTFNSAREVEREELREQNRLERQ